METSTHVAEGPGSGEGGLAGGVVVPHLADHCGGTIGGCLSLEEGGAVERAEVPAGRGVSSCHMGARYQRHM